MLSYPPNLLISDESYSEAIENAMELQNALKRLLAEQQNTEAAEPLHSLFSSRRKILQSELNSFSKGKNIKSNSFSIN